MRANGVPDNIMCVDPSSYPQSHAAEICQGSLVSSKLPREGSPRLQSPSALPWLRPYIRTERRDGSGHFIPNSGRIAQLVPNFHF